MDDKALYWASVVMGALSLVLLVTNVSMVNSNRTLQTEIASRQGAISNSVGLSQINQSLAQALAQAAVDNNDQEIHDLLAAQGITVKPKKK